jgi:hypothetical protein
MAWSSPRTWTSSEIVTAANLNQYVSDNLNALANPPFCDIYATAPGSTSGTAGTPTAISFDSEIADTATMHNPGSNPTRVTVPIDGLYHVEGGAGIAAPGTATYLRTYITLNGTAQTYANVAASTTQVYVTATNSRFVRATVGQYFELFIVCGAASQAIRTDTGLRPYLQVRWVGP